MQWVGALGYWDFLGSLACHEAITFSPALVSPFGAKGLGLLGCDFDILLRGHHEGQVTPVFMVGVIEVDGLKFSAFAVKEGAVIAVEFSFVGFGHTGLVGTGRGGIVRGARFANH
jgi:hypothetical protein